MAYARKAVKQRTYLYKSYAIKLASFRSKADCKKLDNHCAYIWNPDNSLRCTIEGAANLFAAYKMACEYIDTLQGVS